MAADNNKSEILLTTKRLEALTDGIFAFAMTLLVINLTFPDAVSGAPNASLVDLLLGQVGKFFNYGLSFMLLAVFWIVHHQEFHAIKRVDSKLIWINIFLLMFVALVPFSTDVAGDFPGQIISQAFFAANLLILGLLFFLNWFYATRKHKLVDPDLSNEIIKRGTRRSIVTCSVSLLVFMTAFVIPSWCTIFYLLIPIILFLKPFGGKLTLHKNSNSD